MSTRSAIAYTHGDGWRGQYVHSDGYPTVRGAEVYDYLKTNGFAAYKNLIDTHTAGLSWMPAPDEDPHDTPGTKPVTSFSPDTGTKYGNGACYASWGRDGVDTPGEYMTDQNNDPLFIEWVYVADPNGTLTIFASRKTDRMITREGYNGPYETEAWEHYPVWSGRWDGDEPDWAAIENSVYEAEPA